jgi:hypothetical protein
MAQEKSSPWTTNTAVSKKKPETQTHEWQGIQEKPKQASPAAGRWETVVGRARRDRGWRGGGRRTSIFLGGAENEAKDEEFDKGRTAACRTA